MIDGGIKTISDDVSRLVIEVDSKGVVTATGNLANFVKHSKGAGNSTDDLAKKFGAFHLIINKLPGPLKAVAAGFIGMMNPATAAISTVIELGEMAVKYVQESVKAYQEQEVQLVRLGAVLKATGSEAWTSSKELNDYARTLQSATGKSANEIMQMQSVLVGFTGIAEENFNRLTRNMVDMADVMGGSMISAANTFGKALENPTESIGALTRYGFKFTDSQKALIKSLEEANNLASAQKVILESMEKAFGGAAEATGNTIEGTKRKVSALKDEYKALWAEMNNIPTVVKLWLEAQTKYYSRNIELLKEEKELRDINERIKSENPVEKTIAEYERAIHMVNQYKREMAGHGIKDDNDSKAYKRELEYWESIIQKHKPLVDMQNDLTKQQDEYNKKILEGVSGYSLLQAKIEDVYAKTAEAQEKALSDQIKYFNDALTMTRTIAYDMQGNITTDKSKIASTAIIGISEEEKNKIEAVLKYLETSSKNAKQELTEWQKIFKSAMNLSDSDTKQSWFTRQSSAINKFNEILVTANDRAKILYNTLGIENKTLEQAAEAWEEIASNMIMNGEWLSNNTLFQQVAEYAKETRDAANEANLDNYISDLNAELNLLRMTSSEMEKQRLISDYKVINEEKILQAFRLQRLINNEQSLSNMLSSGSGINIEKILGVGNVSKQIEEIMNQFNGLRKIADVKVELGLTDIVNGLSDIERRYEGFIETLIDPEFTDLLIENAELIAEKTGESFIDVAARMLDEYGIITKELLEQLRQARENTTNAKADNLMQELEKRKELIRLSEEEIRLMELKEQFGNTRGQELFDLEQEIAKIENLKSAMKSLIDSFKDLAAGGYLDFFNDLGKAFNQGADFTKGFNSALKNMLKSLIDAMPQLLLNVGLQLMSKNIYLGLAFIAASGLMSFVSGMTKNAEDTGQKDETERLRNLQQQIMDLIDAQRTQQEYYIRQKQRINNTATRVNDAIITPRGVVYTHPEDYIIATKRPQDLMSGGANVIIQINNNANATVTQTESTDPNGSKLIELTIENVMRKKIANGDMDSAIDAMNRRRDGIRRRS